MSSSPEPAHSLNSHHRDTLLQLFQHPTSHNIEWPNVLSLLGAVGSVEQLHDGKFRVRAGPDKEVFLHPKGKDVDAQQVVDVRRVLEEAGYGALVKELEAKGKEV